MKNKKTDRRKKWSDLPKCDFCGKRGKIYRRKNYPHGRKSKPVVTKLCRACKERR